MEFDKSVYKKKYLIKSIKEVEQDYKIKVNYTETDKYLIIPNKDYAIKVADYYIYIYNENK